MTEIVQWEPVAVRGEVLLVARAGHEAQVRESARGLAPYGATVTAVPLEPVVVRLRPVRADDLVACAEKLAAHVTPARFLFAETAGGALTAVAIDEGARVERVSMAWPEYLAREGAANAAYDLLRQTGGALPGLRDSTAGVAPGATLDAHAAALAANEVAARLLPDRFEAHQACAWLLNELGRPADAVAHSERALAASTQSPAYQRADVLTTIAFSRSMLGDHAHACEALREANRLARSPLHTRNLAVGLMYLGAFDEADALIARSRHGRHLVDVAASFARLDDPALAAALLRVGLSFEPTLLEPQAANVVWPLPIDFAWAEQEPYRAILHAARDRRTLERGGA